MIERIEILRDLRLGAFDAGRYQPVTRGFGHSRSRLSPFWTRDKEGFLKHR
jgi:hypothetical protein